MEKGPSAALGHEQGEKKRGVQQGPDVHTQIPGCGGKAARQHPPGYMGSDPLIEKEDRGERRPDAGI